jgi:CDP-2,3-bis-(O-geranylgeranyl)-sn-glycerol synthase
MSLLLFLAAITSNLANVVFSTVTFYIPAYLANLGIVLFWFAIGKKPRFIVSKKWFGANRSYEAFFVAAIVGGVSGLFVSGFKIGLLLGIGVWVGSMASSFIKRRLKIKSGGRMPLIDQLDFILGATLMASFISFNLLAFTFAIIITPPVHRLGNIFLFKLGIKDVPY